MAKIAVAPLVGAWIEISSGNRYPIGVPSLPSWERGLKSHVYDVPLPQYKVAPLVGAWIEINTTHCLFGKRIVAPLVGAWIEIVSDKKLETKAHESLPSWERGLKYDCYYVYD